MTYEHNGEVFFTSTINLAFPLVLQLSFHDNRGKLVDVKLHKIE
jgi:hypothetical protein